MSSDQSLFLLQVGAGGMASLDSSVVNLRERRPLFHPCCGSGGPSAIGADLRIPSFLRTLLLTSQLRPLTCCLGRNCWTIGPLTDHQLFQISTGPNTKQDKIGPVPMPAVTLTGSSWRSSTVCMFPNKNTEDLFRSLPNQMLLPGFHRILATLVLPSV